MRAKRLNGQIAYAGIVVVLSSSLLLICEPAAAELNLGTWQHPTNIPIPVAQAAAATDPTTGLIYLAGGYFSSPGAIRSGRQFQIYDPGTNTWATGPDMPVDTRGATAVYHGGKILVFGNTHSGDANKLQIFDIATPGWSLQTFGGGLWEQSATVGPSGKVYVFGGEADTSTPQGTNTTLEYDPATGATATKAPMPIARKQHESGVIDGALLVVAGNALFNLATRQVDRYDPQANTWSTAPADLTTARLQFAGGVLGNHFIVAGGSTENTGAASPYFASVEVYDPVANAWSAAAALPEGLRESAAAVSGDSFYVFGGFQAGPSLSNEVYRISIVPEPRSLSWIAALAAVGWFRSCRRPKCVTTHPIPQGSA